MAGFAWLTLSSPWVQARLGEAVVTDIILPGLVYTGNASCAGSNCHSADEAKEQSGQNIGDEYNIWTEHDPHAHAYESLKEEISRQIAGNLKLGDPLTEARCLECHALNAAKDKQGEKFSIEDGASCESCHGPAEKWLKPHKEAGWTMKQRQEAGAQGLFTGFGLVDTSNLGVRANTCVVCHLQTDQDMIEAGHPTQEFELYAYNYLFVSKSNPDLETQIHWDEPLGVMRNASLWAVGQAAAKNAVEKQVGEWKTKGWNTQDAEGLLAIYKAGLAVAKQHFGAETVAGLASAKITPESAAAAAADLAKVGSQAGNEVERRTVAFGVAALSGSIFDSRGAEVPDAFWEAYNTATSGEGDDGYIAALNQMIELSSE
jgi:hypothetical protein